jgi:heat shock protein beta
VTIFYRYFSRVESLLRRSLGVSESAKVQAEEVKPAPPVEQGPSNPDADSSDDEGTLVDDNLEVDDDEEDDDEEKSKGGAENWEDWTALKKKFGKGKKSKTSDPAAAELEHDEL